MNKDPFNPTQAEILIVDDVPGNLNVLCQTLESGGYNVIAAPNGNLALQILSRTRPDLILLDIVMPEMNGFEVCRRLKADAATTDIPVIFITVKDETESLVEGFQVGGVDYITKPFNEKEVLVRVETHLKIHRLTQELLQKNRALEQEIAARRQAEQARDEAEKARQTANERLSLISQREAERWGIAGFVGQSETLRNILTDVRRLQATGRTSVLITGESGTGKELIARAIHFGSSRKDGPFFRVNCSAIPTALAESLLFGHVQGAFTGAVSDRKGYFELADGGTLFLDEIGEMPLELQVKLLRVFEDRSFIPIGGTHEKPVDVRILAATNADLQAKIRDGRFREDLYFRIAVFTVKVPPLRARPTDIPLLANHFLQMYSADMGISRGMEEWKNGRMEGVQSIPQPSNLPTFQSPRLSSEALEALMNYHFPGNVRELKNIIERALIESGGAEIQPEHLLFIQSLASPQAAPNLAEAGPLEIPLNMKEGEIFLIKRALKKANGNVSEAARLLGVTRATIYRKLGYEGDLS